MLQWYILKIMHWFISPDFLGHLDCPANQWCELKFHMNSKYIWDPVEQEASSVLQQNSLYKTN